VRELAWILLAAGLCASSGPARAQTDSTARMPEVVVEGRSDGLLGVAESASEGDVGAEQLAERPLLRAGEVLESVPGLIVTQHSGEGKANQYFLRGFNLDHGTDFATTLEGVPVNLPSHGHGQGYTDLGFTIPELVRTVSYRKGVYSAADGDFSSAGAADLEYFDTLPAGLASVQGGMFGEFRALLAASPELAGGHLLYAGELAYDDGPWRNPSNFLKGNLVLRWTTGDASSGWSLTGMGYKADWGATDQIAGRAVERGELDRFGTLDDSDAGRSQRYGISAEWHRRRTAAFAPTRLSC
jgi:TonB-dependent receptor-like protein